MNVANYWIYELSTHLVTFHRHLKLVKWFWQNSLVVCMFESFVAIFRTLHIVEVYSKLPDGPLFWNYHHSGIEPFFNEMHRY